MLLKLEVKCIHRLSDRLVFLQMKVRQVRVTKCFLNCDTFGRFKHHQLLQQIESLRRCEIEDLIEGFSSTFRKAFYELPTLFGNLLDVVYIRGTQVFANQFDLAFRVGSREERFST